MFTIPGMQLSAGGLEKREEILEGQFVGRPRHALSHPKPGFKILISN